MRPTTLAAAASALLLACAAYLPSQAHAQQTVHMDDMDVIGPFASWANAKTGYGAIGDGVADDTAALQRALDDLGKPGKPAALYLPPGTYRITSTLRLNGRQSSDHYAYAWGGLSITGEHPQQTTILWDGPQGEAMLIQDGGFNYRYSRITWNGNRKAGYGIAHWWNASTGTIYDGSSEDIDEVFVDMGIGIMGGRGGQNYGQLNSEGQVRRVKFVRNWVAGVDLGEFNALNWWIWDSHFVDCARGVSNTFSLLDNNQTGTGAGGFHVYRSLFERSTVADINIGNTQWFSLHNNTSSNSRRFFQAEGAGANNAAIIMQRNVVIDPTDPTAVDDGNLGPLMMIDNVFMRPASVSGPQVRMSDWVSGRDVLSLGNIYTGTPAIENGPQSGTVGDRTRRHLDVFQSRASLAPQLPQLPPTPARATHPVIEVPSGASAAVIQAAINQAAQSPQGTAIVHLPPGHYLVNQTLVIPASKRIQIAGDGLTTTLEWNGPSNGTVFRLEGPSQATIRDLHMLHHGFTVIAAEINRADQAGGRIFMEGNFAGMLQASALSQTQLSLQANTAFSGLTLNDVGDLVSIGANIGPVISNNSTVLLSDTWYEGHGVTDLFKIGSGNFTYLGGVIAPASTSPTAPAMSLNNFSGRLAWVGASFEIGGLASGIGVQIDNETVNTNAMFLGQFFRKPQAFRRNASGGTVGLVEAKNINPTGSVANIPDQGSYGNAQVATALQQARSLVWATAPYQPPAGATDVRIYRVKINQTGGIKISGQ